jgi:hypothetical protein
MDDNQRKLINSKIIIFGFIAYLALLTSFFSKIGIDGFTVLHNEVAKTLIALRLDVVDFAVAGEAFTVGSKLHTYFGITPSLLRLPFQYIFNPQNLSLIANILAFYLCLKLTFKLCWNLNSALFFSIIIYLLYFSVGTYVYHENILWAIDFGIISILFYRKNEGFKAIFFLFLAFHSRPTIGLGISALYFFNLILGHSPQVGIRRKLLFIFAVSLVSFSYLSINLLKFGSLVPLPSQHIQNSINNPLMQSYSGLVYLPRNFAAYLGSPSIFGDGFYRNALTLLAEHYTSYRRELLGIDDAVYGLLYVPFFCMAFYYFFKDYKKSLSAFLALIFILLILFTFGGINHRYTLDIFPIILLMFSNTFREHSKPFDIWVVLFSLSYLYFVAHMRQANVMAYLH